MVSSRVQTSDSLCPAPLGPADRAALEAFLSADSCANLFQLSWLENYGMSPHPSRRDFFFAGVRAPQTGLAAVALAIGQSLLLVHSTQPQAAARLGQWFRQREFLLDHLVSQKASVEPFWKSYAAEYHRKTLNARLISEQDFYVLDRQDWAGAPEPGGPVESRIRYARPEELEAVYLASARMHLEETGENPLNTNPESFRDHVAQRIRTRRCFVRFDAHRRLLFKADLSALSSFGAQIAGVYTAPQFRGQGIATRALFDICGELFEGGHRRVTLYVNAHNAAAHRVYRKVGFKFHAPYQTVFVESNSA